MMTSSLTSKSHADRSSLASFASDISLPPHHEFTMIPVPNIPPSVGHITEKLQTIPNPSKDAKHPVHHFRPPRQMGPDIAHLDLPHHRTNHTRRIRPGRRLSSIQIPDLVLVLSLLFRKDSLLPTLGETIPHHTRGTLSSTPRREFRR